MSCMEKKGFATRQIHVAHPHLEGISPLATPIFQTSTFVFDNTAQGAARFAGEQEGYIYTRLGNPNANEVGAKVASLEGGEAGVVMASGMGAISGTLWTLLKAGDHVLADRALYGCTYACLTTGLIRYGIEVTQVDFSNLEEIKNGIQPNTAVVYFETESNPDLKIADISAIAGLVHGLKPDIKVVVDNTFVTPYLIRPLELGADVVVHSATKYLNGHGDVVAGVAVSSKEIIHEIAHYGMKDMTGAVVGPFEAFLLNRGIKTLDIRMTKHCASAQRIAEFLESHSAVKKVLYPGLKSHPQHELAKRLFEHGFGGMVTFELNCDKKRAETFINSLSLCALAVSLGDTETLIEHPASMTHSTYSPEALAEAGIRESMIRLSVGLEDPEDVIADLKEQLDKI